MLTSLEQDIGEDSINLETFPLPITESILARACSEVHQGRGFVILRGLGPDKYTPQDATKVFLGIASYIGNQRGVQDRNGSMLSMRCYISMRFLSRNGS